VHQLQADFEKNVPVSTTVSMEKVQTVDPVINPGRRVDIRKLNPRAGDPNHVTTVSIQIGIPDIADSVTFGILSQVLKPAAYDELRTNQQLGYVVQGGISMNSNVMQASVMVQGTQKLPDEIEPQIQMVLTTIMRKKLKEMTDEEFNAFKASYAKQILEPPLGFSDEIDHFWPVVARGGSCPDKALMLLKYLREDMKSKDQLLAAWDRVVGNHHGQPARPKVVVKYFSDTLGDIPEAPTFDKFAADLTALSVPKDAVELAKREFADRTILSKVDSQARAEILKHESAKFYPQTIKCSFKSSKEDAPTSFMQKRSTRKKSYQQYPLETDLEMEQ